jgi:hypothetical protein
LMLTNLKRRVVKDDAVAPFILVWQRYEGLTESNLFTNKPDALREFTWMKMLGRDVALYDFESSLLEKSADEDLIFEFDAFAENQIAIGRDWADEVDGNAPYTVVW